MLKSLVPSVSSIKGLFKAISGGLPPSPLQLSVSRWIKTKLHTIKKGKPGFQLPSDWPPGLAAAFGCLIACPAKVDMHLLWEGSLSTRFVRALCLIYTNEMIVLEKTQSRVYNSAYLFIYLSKVSWFSEFIAKY